MSKFSLFDYFSKYGFEDGDNPFLESIAEEYGARIARRLSEAFRRRGLPYRAAYFNPGTTHNSCRMSLSWKDKDGRSVWDQTYGLWNSDNTFLGYEPPEGVQEVLQVTDARLRKEMRKLARVARNTRALY